MQPGFWFHFDQLLVAVGYTEEWPLMPDAFAWVLWTPVTAIGSSPPVWAWPMCWRMLPTPVQRQSSYPGRNGLAGPDDWNCLFMQGRRDLTLPSSVRVCMLLRHALGSINMNAPLTIREGMALVRSRWCSSLMTLWMLWVARVPIKTPNCKPGCHPWAVREIGQSGGPVAHHDRHTGGRALEGAPWSVGWR